MINTDLLCYLNGSINASIVNDKNFHLVNSLYFAGDVFYCLWQTALFIVAWYLDYELHDMILPISLFCSASATGQKMTIAYKLAVNDPKCLEQFLIWESLTCGDLLKSALG